MAATDWTYSTWRRGVIPDGDTVAAALLASLATQLSVAATDRRLIKFTVLTLHLEEIADAIGGNASQSQAGFSYTAYQLDQLYAAAKADYAALESELDASRVGVAIVPGRGRIARTREGGVR